MTAWALKRYLSSKPTLVSRQKCLGQFHPIRHAERCGGIVEVVVWIVEQTAAVGGAIPEPNVRAWPLFQHEREVFGSHARRQVGAHVFDADQRFGDPLAEFGFGSRVDGR